MCVFTSKERNTLIPSLQNFLNAFINADSQWWTVTKYTYLSTCFEYLVFTWVFLFLETCDFHSSTFQRQGLLLLVTFRLSRALKSAVNVFSFLKYNWPHAVFLTEGNRSQYPLSTGTDVKAEIRHPGVLCNRRKQAPPLSFKQNSVVVTAGERQD